MELKALAVTFALAFLTETLVEYLFGTPADKLPRLAPYKWLLMYISAGVGVGLALFYRLDLIAIISHLSGELLGLAQTLDDPTTVGMVLSGLIIGRGANFLSDFLSKYLKPKPLSVGRTVAGTSRSEIPF